MKIKKKRKQRLISDFNELSNDLDKNEVNRIIDLYRIQLYEDYNNKIIKKDKDSYFGL